MSKDLCRFLKAKEFGETVASFSSNVNIKVVILLPFKGTNFSNFVLVWGGLALISYVNIYSLPQRNITTKILLTHPSKLSTGVSRMAVFFRSGSPI